MRADIHDGPELMLQSETEYIDARPHLPASTKSLLHRAAGPYIRVTPGKTRVKHNESALPRAADVRADVAQGLRRANKRLCAPLSGQHSAGVLAWPRPKADSGTFQCQCSFH